MTSLSLFSLSLWKPNKNSCQAASYARKYGKTKIDQTIFMTHKMGSIIKPKNLNWTSLELFFLIRQFLNKKAFKAYFCKSHNSISSDLFYSIIILTGYSLFVPTTCPHNPSLEMYTSQHL